MKKEFDNRNLNEALELLGAMLERQSSRHYALVVCGGSALITMGLVSRTTKDVDVVAMQDEYCNILPIREIPAELQEIAGAVAEQLQLPDNWLNAGPGPIINRNLPHMGLPEGFSGRLTQFKYGGNLTVSFISRLDQVFFKTFAAADKGGPSYHLDDLLKLKPAAQELLEAARWSMIQDPSPAFRTTLEQMFNSIGFPDAASKI